jgi:Tol biopolymer transport system component
MGRQVGFAHAEYIPVKESLLILAVVICFCRPVVAEQQQPNAAAQAAERLVEQIRQNPAEPSTAAGRIGLYVIEVASGEATLAASEPEPHFVYCGSAAWSRDGKRIYFDNTTANVEHNRTRIKAIHLKDGHLAVADLGPGNGPSPSPSGEQVIFLLLPDAVPGAESGVWLMNADGSGRRLLGGHGRSRWSLDGHQFLIISFFDPPDVTVIDDRPDHKSGLLKLPDQKVYSVPAWAGDGTIVAVIGDDAGDAIALLDVSDPQEAKIKQTLWKRGQDLDIKPLSPVYAPETGSCVFVGEQEGKGRTLYSIQRGKTGPPRRLEAEGFDHLLQSLSFSPGGRFVAFSSDRPDRRKR